MNWGIYTSLYSIPLVNIHKFIGTCFPLCALPALSVNLGGVDPLRDSRVR